jgi:iron complex transport system ATP-binding protein
MLELHNICAGYGANDVLHEISLNVARGEIATVIGPNGCGKSTLLRCAAGLLKPSRGEVRLNDEDIFALPPRERARRVALLPQRFEGGGELPVFDVVMLGRTPFLSAYGAPSSADENIVNEALAAVEAESLVARHMGELSGGEAQRVMLARALAQQAPVLLLDEPTSNLDLRFQLEVLSLVKKLSCERELCSVLVLHHINLATQVSDKMLLLDAGRSVAAGTPVSVITEENLSSVFGVQLDVSPHPRTGRPHAIAQYEI